jgi:hypothetical protein
VKATAILADNSAASLASAKKLEHYGAELLALANARACGER